MGVENWSEGNLEAVTRPTWNAQDTEVSVPIVILGAGIAGLTAASVLSRFTETYGVYEQSSSVGGLCRTQLREGFTLETVSHVLHFRSSAAKQLVEGMLDGNLSCIKRSAWIYFQERYVPYPFQTHLAYLPWRVRIACLAGYYHAWLGQRLNHHHETQNLGEWIESYLGPGIARHFMTPYNTKLWGVPPGEMSVDWVRPFLPGTSVMQVTSGSLFKRRENVGYNRHFYYPTRGGTQALVEALNIAGGKVELGRCATGIDFDRKTVRFQDGSQVRYEQLISTVPLKNLILLAAGVPESLCRAAETLHSTSLLNISYCIRHPLPHSFHWVYFPEPQFPFFRLVFPSNISSSLAPKNCGLISAEISHPDPERQDWLEERSLELILQLGMIKRRSDVAFSVRNHVAHAYPVHGLERAATVTKLREFLKSRGVWSIGRFGAWQYSSIDDAIVEAIQACQEILPLATGRDARIADVLLNFARGSSAAALTMRENTDLPRLTGG